MINPTVMEIQSCKKIIGSRAKDLFPMLTMNENFNFDS